MNPTDWLNVTFTRQLVQTPSGRAHLLAQIADAEGSAEAALFPRLLEATQGQPELQRALTRHAADEERHARQLEALLARTGAPRPSLPSALNILTLVKRRLPWADEPLTSRAALMRAFALLQVIEERAVHQFPLLATALRGVDDAAADTFERMTTEEAGHVKLCEALGQRFTDEPAAREAALRDVRRAMLDAKAEHERLSLRHLQHEGLLGEGVRALPWKAAALWAGLHADSHGLVDPRFTVTDEPAVHDARRRAILQRHPAVRSLFGYDRRTIAVTIAVVAAQVWVAARVASQPVWLVALVAYGVGALLSHWLGQTIHETSHNLAARTRWANVAVAWLANAPMVLPIAATFHRYHLSHHAHLGVAGKDSDLPLPAELDLIGTRRWAKAVWLLLYPLVYFVRGAVYAQRPSRAEVANVVFVGAVTAGLWWWLGPSAVLYLALSTYFGHGPHPVAAHFLHEHYLFAGRTQETFSYDGPLNWVTFNVGFHAEHHDFMSIPGWRLPEYRRLTQGAYAEETGHGSWTCVLWEFVTSSQLGPAARRVRTS